MDGLELENQILLLEAVRRFFPQSENKELVMPMICQWYNERATQFLPAAQFRDMLTALFDISPKVSGFKRPFTVT
jgi:hypothetical protein